MRQPQLALDFQSTVFPTISTLTADGGAEGRRLLFAPLQVPGVDGAFIDVVSGPRAIAFSPDGTLALMADSGSEDVLVFDATSGNERGLVRPLPAAMLEGITVDHRGARAYVDGRNTHNVVVLDLSPADGADAVTVDGDPIERLVADPMPAPLRLGQRLFYSANSSAFPVTQNFWVSCSSCHLEGRTDAVTWLFSVGPRDTPSNAGGPINTGFLLRQALRNSVVDYDTTINVEQGGSFHRDDAMARPLLDALAGFVNFAIPYPQNPNRSTDGTLTPAQQQGQAIFAARCTSCHTGPHLTDSGSGNPTLDLNGPIVLHDIDTCVKSGFVDQPAPDDVVGMMHTACDFDTPTLRGIFATPPYFHDGSAATLLDAVNRLPAAAGLAADDQAALVEYLKTL
jgi:cytochrome c peroxidase